MNKVVCFLFCIILFSTRSFAGSMDELIDRVFKKATVGYVAMDNQLDEKSFPKSVSPDGNLLTSDYRWWCSGFYPGSLWYIYEYTGDENIRHLAEKYTLRLELLKDRTDDHDIGFQLNCSFGNGFKLTKNTTYKNVLVNGAYSLASRFNETVGVIRSWDFVMEGRNWQFPVIIDNMMNLELLMVASELSGDTYLSEVACKHAFTTLKNHFRPDGSSFHLVDYDIVNGGVRNKETVQGYTDDSSWARGQAWALYGFTMMYGRSGNILFLNHAEKIADMIIEKLPEDGVPLWDFNCPVSLSYKDTSAASIMASALLELSKMVKDTEKQIVYFKIAEKQLKTLGSPVYLAEDGENNCNFLLKHGVGNFPAGSEIDVPLTYSDYYFLEALLRYKKYCF